MDSMRDESPSRTNPYPPGYMVCHWSLASWAVIGKESGSIWIVMGMEDRTLASMGRCSGKSSPSYAILRCQCYKCTRAMY